MLHAHTPLPYVLVRLGGIPPCIAEMSHLEKIDLSAMQLGGEKRVWVTVCGTTASLVKMAVVCTADSRERILAFDQKKWWIVW